MTAELQPSGSERRHGARFTADFWVSAPRRIGAEEPRRLKGNISASGLYLYTDTTLGSVGSLVTLRISTIDRSRTLEVLAHVVRQIRLEDMYRGDVLAGIALGFIIRGAEQLEEVHRFVGAVAEVQRQQQRPLSVDTRLSALVERPGQQAGDATIQTLTPDGMVMRTSWHTRVGEAIQVEVRTPASRKLVLFSGQVTSCERVTRPDGRAWFEVHVSFATMHRLQRDGSAPPGEPSSLAPEESPDPISPLLEELARPAPSPRHTTSIFHLKGTLDQMGVPSLLSFLELERRSGRIKVTTPNGPVRLLVRDGQLVDARVESAPARAPRDIVADLMDLDRGEFELAFQPVTEPDRIGVSTSALLLDLARCQDEISR